MNYLVPVLIFVLFKCITNHLLDHVPGMQIVIHLKGGEKDDCKGSQSPSIPLDSEMGTDWQRFGLELVQCGLAPILNTV